MKNLMLASSLFVLFFGAAEAAVVTCAVDLSNGFQDNYHAVAISRLAGNCIVIDHKEIDLAGEKLSFEISGFGPGLGIIGAEALVLTCPTAKAKNLKRTPFFGVKAHFTPFLAGADAGIFANKNGGTCILTGITLIGASAGISGAKLKFTDLNE